ncbi:hypothetical protein [Paragemmobacter straminiformis]|uniref:Phytanoyl-CoA dioxygenase (PhyH) n=1 Tax=Paragemmobacter straminiformis TaxID=2045119 RepID=A0A842I4M6_9RHOB|nr:hypothetical protein [Gemmobacter straminiformis]MBC2835082.1 hypothetical protein [Gemmobacter straminiformis]
MFDRTGWRRVTGQGIAAWAAAAGPIAARAVADSTEAWRCGGTWFVGLDALANDASGAVGGRVFPWSELGLAPVALHRGQLSVVRAGYPQPSEAETEAAFRFRLNRDAAHLDGLIAEGPEKRRRVVEPHRWIVGMALNDADEGASPLVLWEGSHRIMRDALLAALRGLPEADWGKADITEAYQAARKRVFAECPRLVLPQRRGEAVVLHRLVVHGVAPWAVGAGAAAPGRMVAYFRPLMGSVAEWLLAE